VIPECIWRIVRRAQEDFRRISSFLNGSEFPREHGLWWIWRRIGAVSLRSLIVRSPSPGDLNLLIFDA